MPEDKKNGDLDRSNVATNTKVAVILGLIAFAIYITFIWFNF